MDPVKLAPVLGWQEPPLLLGLGDAWVDDSALAVGVVAALLVADPQEATRASSTAAGTAHRRDL
ncbi:MAG: hypothetical protein ACHRXM_38695 [Isosphaerales bacterium]